MKGGMLWSQKKTLISTCIVISNLKLSKLHAPVDDMSWQCSAHIDQTSPVAMDINTRGKDPPVAMVLEINSLNALGG